MTFKPSLWHPIAIVLSAINLLGAGAALQAEEGWHAALHVVLAIGFGYWARHLRPGHPRGGRQARLEELEAGMGNLDALEAEMTRLREELGETQERLDFTERMLAQRPDPRRLDPEL